jgi:ABC-type lipoprotein export system ATPase subunit
VRGAALALAAGEAVALLGPSGCGKTTLLHMLGLLERPSAGRVFVDGADAWSQPTAARARLRLARIGFVFQQGNLLPHFSARENVALPAWHLSGARADALRRADELLEKLGLAARRDVDAARLSGGEAQRVAIARALINRPGVLLLDEPTGNLDTASAAVVLDALAEVRARTAVLLVTHDPNVAARLDRTVHMLDGALGGTA